MTITVSSQQLHVPPHNLDAERSVLGAVMLDEHYLGSMVLETGLTERDFYRPQHGLVFSVMHELHDAGEPIDPLTVAAKLAERGKLEGAARGRSGPTWGRSHRRTSSINGTSLTWITVSAPPPYGSVLPSVDP